VNESKDPKFLSYLFIQMHITTVALSLYAFNVPPSVRAKRIHDHFDGDCMDLEELIRAVDSPYAMTELPFPSARLYLQHAIEAYANEALERVLAGVKRLSDERTP
jgi:hypothetical protein